ncbi:MAG: hypothetical protein KAI67_04535 [Candidatus Pacebacteria bacterium]|nr:hypothetical protein [Candidatus Paceibacterota bacterium]
MEEIDDIFETQLDSGEIPTLMMNYDEGTEKWVDTVAITMVAVYLAQLNPKWEKKWRKNIEAALEFIEKKTYKHKIEDLRLWHFNGFYPPDWEDTGFAIYLLVKNGRLNISKLESLKTLFLGNATEDGVGVWVKDSYSSDNKKNNQWDPTSSLNILRLYYILQIDRAECEKAERFIMKYLSLDKFEKGTLYYTAPIAAFFAKRLISDFSIDSNIFSNAVNNFYQEVVDAILKGLLEATSFERALFGLHIKEIDDGSIFHHGMRIEICYGSPVLCKLALLNLWIGMKY